MRKREKELNLVFYTYEPAEQEYNQQNASSKNVMNKISQTHTLFGYNFVLSKVFKTHSEYNTIFSKLKLYAKTKKQQHRKESC